MDNPTDNPMIRLLLSQFEDPLLRTAKNTHDARVLSSALFRLQKELGILPPEKERLLETLHEDTLRESERSRKGGLHKTGPEGILLAIKSILQKKPSLTAQQVWEKIPAHSEIRIGEYTVYRDGGVLYQDSPTGTRKVSRNHFNRLIAKARKELGINPR